jgi:CDGSH-type Zn-finger protein
MNDTSQNASGASLFLCPDGPILVPGDFDIVTPEGDPAARQRKTVALCRCWASAIKRHCDGTHKMTNCRTESPGSQNPGNPDAIPGIAQTTGGKPPGAKR